jgi:hypothetical protein
MNGKSFTDTLKEVQSRSASQAETAADQLAPDLVDLDGAYQAHARPSNKSVQSIHLLLGKEGVRSFQYVHLDSDSQFRTGNNGQVIVVRFAGLKSVQVTIRGRNLWRLYDYLHQHRMPWIMRADRDFADDKEPIITAIDFEDVV